jgi:hypothetical protein
MAKLNFDVWKLIWATEKWLLSWIKKAVVVLEEELKRLTPEDTLEMLNSYESEVQSNWDSVEGTVWNKAEHAVFVEYWAEKAYNYHKPKWSVFYKWVWNRTFARWLDGKKTEILSIITKELWKQ